jgi:hypothetical protein
MMIETLESREFCSVTPGFTGGVYVAAGDVNGDTKASRIVVVQPTTAPQPASPNVVIAIIAVLIG